MTIAYWCLLAVVIAPSLLSVIARSAATQAEYVGDPRAYSDTLQGWRRRAHLAEQNALEAVPAFIAGLLVAELAGASRAVVDGLALAFVAFRILHAVLYITDRPRLRSEAWRFGMLCVIGLFVAAALAG